MLVESMAASLAVGKVRGGKLKNFEKVNIRAWYLFIIGFILEFGSVYFKLNKVQIISTFIGDYFIYIHGLSYILIFTGLVLNFKIKPMILVFVGTLLNFIVIIANGGRMPVSGTGLKDLGLLKELDLLTKDSMITHTLVSPTTKLSFLGDVIPISNPYPLPKMISIGDIFIALGIFLFIQNVMKNDS